MPTKFYKVSLTEVISMPPFQIPKSTVIVELRIREGDEENARQRASRAAESAFMPLFHKGKVEKIVLEVTPIDKPASEPRMCTIIGGIKTWFTPDARQ